MNDITTKKMGHVFGGGKGVYADTACRVSVNKLTVLVESIESGKITIPDFQRDVDEDKITEIIEVYKAKRRKNEEWFITQCSMHLCAVSDVNGKKLYLVDGQHRIAAMQQLHKEGELYGDAVVICKMCNAIDEMKEYYGNLNINSDIPINFTALEDIFYTNELLKIKNRLKRTYKGWGMTHKTGPTNYFRHIDDFINKFNVDVLKKHLSVEQITETHIWNLLMDMNQKVSDEIQLIPAERTGRFANAANWNKMNGQNFYLAYHGVDWDMFAVGYGVQLHIKKPKGDIPKRVRDQLWNNTFPRTTEGKCYCCACDIGIHNFEAGHKVSEYRGGEIKLTNLEPVCGGCNRSMGIMDMDDFKQMLQ